MIGPSESPYDAALREFREETGFTVVGPSEPLGKFRQNSSKDLTVWAMEGDCAPDDLVSNSFTMEWPPKSGKTRTFPEADRGGWLAREEALIKIVKGQRPVLEAFYARSNPREK